MKLSVIIPTLNRAKLLNITLQSICKQIFKQVDFEVIIVDNGSTDDTKEIVETYKNKIQNIEYFYETAPGLHVGRHKGLKEAKAEILVYADDDIEALPTWLEGIWESFQEEKVVLVGGNNLPKYEILSPIWVESLWNYNQFGKINGNYSLIDFGNEIKEINSHFVFGCNFSIRKKILLEFGGFHPDAMPRENIKYRGDGESYISKMIHEKGYKTIFNPKASVYHFVSKNRMTKEYLYHRGFIQGISDSYTEIRSRKGKQKNYSKAISLFDKIANRILSRDLKIELNKIKLLLNELSNDFKNQSQKGYLDGYNYHQNEVKIDNKLMEWVLKENYLTETK